MAQSAPDYMAAARAQAGEKRIHGVVGNSLNGSTDTLRGLRQINRCALQNPNFAAVAKATTTFDEARHFGVFKMTGTLDGRARD